MKNDRCVIISGGDYDDAVEIKSEDYVIACDKGYEHACRMGIKPDLVVGDFDSYTGEVEAGIPVERYPVRKDDTDTMAAVKLAVEKGYNNICICCAFGGRMDHAFANYQSAVYAAKKGCDVCIIGNDTKAFFIHNGEKVLECVKGWSLSVFSMSDESQGVSIEGTEYDVSGVKLSSDYPLGVSNEWKEKTARISVESGTLMIVESRMGE
ncbi:MAG: thiamine diphosphokinase [Lachnospiraceae bacterium]|nr:thiamine diphosphokinase [Lachnospiraceae bacterium]